MPYNGDLHTKINSIKRWFEKSFQLLSMFERMCWTLLIRLQHILTRLFGPLRLWNKMMDWSSNSLKNEIHSKLLDKSINILSIRVDICDDPKHVTVSKHLTVALTQAYKANKSFDRLLHFIYKNGFPELTNLPFISANSIIPSSIWKTRSARGGRIARNRDRHTDVTQLTKCHILTTRILPNNGHKIVHFINRGKCDMTEMKVNGTILDWVRCKTTKTHHYFYF